MKLNLKKNNPLFYKAAPWSWKLKRLISKPLFGTLNYLSFQFRMLNAGQRALPDYLIIGAAKSGTSSLYRTLAQHPNIAPALKKEIYFFCHYQNFDRGLNWYKAHFYAPLYRWWKKMRGINKLVTGESTPIYLLTPFVPERVKAVVPGVKIIVMMRNPVDRAYSHFYHVYRPRRETLEFKEALEKEEERIRDEYPITSNGEGYEFHNYPTFAYKYGGVYADQLQPWLSAFPKEQFLFIQSERYYKDHQQVYNEVLDFLGLPHYTPSKAKKKIYPSYTKMDPDIRASLVQFFKPHNQRLYELLGQTFDWDK